METGGIAWEENIKKRRGTRQKLDRLQEKKKKKRGAREAGRVPGVLTMSA